MHESEVFRQRILEEGILDPSELEAAFGKYLAQPHRLNFASFLLQKNLISVTQLAEMSSSQGEDGQTSPPEPDDARFIGQTHSGCVIERLLERGGMGSVFLAKREEDGELVVLKFLAPHLAMNPSLRRRFLREGSVLEKLPPHPNVVRTYAVDGENEPPYILMEYVDGLSLRKLLEERWCLPWREAVRLGRDIALGLANVHDHAIIHRDVKPANVVVTPSGVVKVLDFGLAKDLFATSLTQPGTRLGTPYYMAPEQWGQHDTDARCDVFSLGSSLYHLLTGQPPFLGKDTKELGERVLSGIYPPPRELVPELPRDLELVLFQMLQVDRRFRYPNMKVCAEDLDRVLEGLPARVPRLVPCGEGERPLPLLPHRSFVVGREQACDIQLQDSSVSRRHVRFRREQTGFVLTDLRSTYGTWIDGMRVTRPLSIKNGDEIRVGKVLMRFEDPWPPARPAESGIQDITRREVPHPIHEALVAMRDPRVTSSLIENLTPDRWELQAIRHTLRTLYGDQDTIAIFEERDRLQTQKRARLPLRLAAIAEREPDADVDGWLQWWNQERLSQLHQIGPARAPRVFRLRALQGEPPGTDFALEEGGVFPIGRDEKCALLLSHRSVSRLHATFFLLHRRLVIRDEGSRLGTVLNKQRTQLAFVDPGDELRLGEVRLSVSLETDPALAIGLDLYAIDPLTFEAMLQCEHPGVTTALLGFLHETRKTGWSEELAADLFQDPARAQDLVARVRTQLEHYATYARELLPRFLGSGGKRVSIWHRQLAHHRSELPPQVMPLGWLATSRGLFAAG